MALKSPTVNKVRCAGINIAAIMVPLLPMQPTNHETDIAWRYRTHACGVRVRCAILYVFLHLALDVKVPRSFSKLLKITILGEISGRGVLENVTDAHYYMDTTDVLDKHCPHTPIVHSNAVTCYEIQLIFIVFSQKPETGTLLIHPKMTNFWTGQLRAIAWRTIRPSLHVQLRGTTVIYPLSGTMFLLGVYYVGNQQFYVENPKLGTYF